MNRTLKTVALVALCAVSGLSRAAAELEKVVEIERPSSDTGFYYQTHLPYLGWPVGIPVGATAANAWFLTKWTLVASAAYGIFYPHDVGAWPAQLVAAPTALVAAEAIPAVAVAVSKFPRYVLNAIKMKQSGDGNALKAGSAVLAAVLLWDYWLPHVANYAYGKIPSTEQVMNPIYAKISGKKKVQTDIVEIAQ